MVNTSYSSRQVVEHRFLSYLIKITLLIVFLFVAGNAQAQSTKKENKEEEEMTAEKMFAKAQHLRKSHKYIESIEEYDKAILEEPNNPKLFFFRGLSFMALKDYSSVVASLNIAVKFKPDFPRAYRVLAEAYAKQERDFKQIQSLNLAYTYDKDVKRKLKYKITIVKILFDKKNYAKALTHIGDAEIITTENLEILYYKGSVFNKQKRYEEAKTVMLIAVKKLTGKPTFHHAKYYFELGFAYHQLEDYPNQTKAFSKANHGHFKPMITRLSPRFYVGTARSYLQINDYNKSDLLLDTALRMQKDFSYAYILKAKIAQKRANQKEAIALYMNAASIEKNPKKLANIYRTLAQLQLDNSLNQDAIITAESLLKLQPYQYNVAFIKATALSNLRRYTEAIAVLEEAVNASNLDKVSKVKFNFALGVIYKKMKNYRMAKVALKKSFHGSFKAVSEIELAGLPKDVLAKAN